MTYEIPFKDVATEIKPLMSGINVDFEFDNISSSIKKAKSDIIDVVGQDIWDLMINHYNSDNYKVDDQQNETFIRLDKLVKYIQDPLVHFGMYRHFIWLIIRVGNSGVTVKKSNDETTAYKYLTDEAKNDLISTAWESINTLIEFLNKEATQYTEWTKGTIYTVGQIVLNETHYYQCNEEHTSSVDFTTDLAKWDALVPATAVIFYQWTESEQYKETKNLIFNDYKDFQKSFGIDKSAYFFVKARHLILQVIEDDISPRLANIESLKKEIQHNNISTKNQETIRKIKRAIAYNVIVLAIQQFDYYELPRSIRTDLDNEFNKRNKEKTHDTIKKQVLTPIAIKAEEYLDKLDRHLNTLTRIEEPDDVEVPTPIADEGITELTQDDKFCSIL
ncbi:MAG: hypothetical protein JEY96_01525 [Bacteroidales bacterium]|nr:hypothetical protein [Bacteroidales bacterium]